MWQNQSLQMRPYVWLRSGRRVQMVKQAYQHDHVPVVLKFNTCVYKVFPPRSQGRIDRDDMM
eukprot:431248-Karenia_brevis.AAC.1